MSYYSGLGSLIGSLAWFGLRLIINLEYLIMPRSRLNLGLREIFGRDLYFGGVLIFGFVQI